MQRSVENADAITGVLVIGPAVEIELRARDVRPRERVPVEHRSGERVAHVGPVGLVPQAQDARRDEQQRAGEGREALGPRTSSAGGHLA